MRWADLFEYRDGMLIWRKRDRCRFGSDRACNSWNAKNAGKVAGNSFFPSLSKTRYVRVRVGPKCYSAHRIIWEMLNGPIDEGLAIDHIDGDGENNNIDNLRLVSHGENCKNRSLQKNNSSGVNGVRWNDRQCKYVARIYVNGRERFLGYYRDFFSAVCARKSAEITHKYHENHGRKSPGQRGHKTLEQDMNDIVASAERARELEK